MSGILDNLGYVRFVLGSVLNDVGHALRVSDYVVNYTEAIVEEPVVDHHLPVKS